MSSTRGRGRRYGDVRDRMSSRRCGPGRSRGYPYRIGHDRGVEDRAVAGIHQLEELAEDIAHIGSAPQGYVDDIGHEPVVVNSFRKLEGMVADFVVREEPPCSWLLHSAYNLQFDDAAFRMTVNEGFAASDTARAR